MPNPDAVPRKTARIHSRKWSIKEKTSIICKENGDVLAGQTHYDTRELWVWTEQDVQMKRESLFHEILHAVNPNLTEKQVEDLEINLYAFFNDNVDLALWMFPALEEYLRNKLMRKLFGSKKKTVANKRAVKRRVSSTKARPQKKKGTRA